MKIIESQSYKNDVNQPEINGLDDSLNNIAPEDKNIKIKNQDTNFQSDLPTITPDEAMSKYFEDDLEKEDETPQIAQERQPKKPLENYPQFNSVFQAFRWAKHNLEVIRIYYITVKGTYLVRDIDPHGDFWARTTLKRILVTWDETVGDIRAFRAENVQKFEFVGDNFQPKFNFSQRRRNYVRRMRNKRNRG